MSDLTDYYEIFDIERGADAPAIEKAIRTARKRWRQLTGSPDRERAQLAERRMAELEAAENALLDDAARQTYDATLAAQQAAPSAPAAPVASSEAWGERAAEYYREGDMNNAFIAAKKGTDLEPGDTFAWLVYGRSAIELKRYREADFASAELVRRAPRDEGSHELRGDVLEAMERYAEVEAAFRRAAEIAPDRVYYAGRAAWALVDQGRAAEGFAEAEALLARFPDEEYPVKVMRAAGERLRDAGDPRRALEVSQRLIGIEASEQHILEAVLAIQDIEQQGDVDAALVSARQLLEAFPNSAKAQRLMRYAIISLRERGRWDEALAESRALLARYPDDQDVRAQVAWSVFGDAEAKMPATSADSHTILNKAQAACYRSAIDQVAALGVADQDVQRQLATKREFLAKKEKVRVSLNFGKIVVAILALVLFLTGLNTMPQGILTAAVGGLLGWWFVVMSFPRQYKLDRKTATPEQRASGLQR
ncbi:tetratricopeptide repeat protein [Microbacterium sp. gxy059]|uniref:tetratricopeptide repeat protein n=1 Tax=Microbacterium sp. gxy059 TaxID=2957199 RepID=UPI003D98DD19